MTKAEAITTWSDACAVVAIGDTFVRNGNWTTIDRALRHCADTSTVNDSKKTLNGDAIIEVKPVAKETVKGKSEMALPPFLLVVK